jgi:hypothetical protein
MICQWGKTREKHYLIIYMFFGMNLSYRKTGFNQTTHFDGVEFTSKDRPLRQLLQHKIHH